MTWSVRPGGRLIIVGNDSNCLAYEAVITLFSQVIINQLSSTLKLPKLKLESHHIFPSG